MTDPHIASCNPIDLQSRLSRQSTTTVAQSILNSDVATEATEVTTAEMSDTIPETSIHLLGIRIKRSLEHVASSVLSELTVTQNK